MASCQFDRWLYFSFWLFNGSSHFPQCLLLHFKQVILNMHDVVIPSQTKLQSHAQQEDLPYHLSVSDRCSHHHHFPKSRIRYCMCTNWTPSSFLCSFTHFKVRKFSMKWSQIHFKWCRFHSEVSAVETVAAASAKWLLALKYKLLSITEVLQSFFTL